MERVIVGMSGGVDSAVAASILVEQGYNVEGLFMKNWDEEDTEFCSVEEDYRDALQVCDTLGIPLRSVNFTTEYWDCVFQEFLDEYQSGRTPNPDVLCNREIKFRAFLDHAIELGASFIATGHYANIHKIEGQFQLLRGIDAGKDQSYFLYMLNQEQLSKSVFPIGRLEKPEVRTKAKKLGFLNFDKKDSTGICFIGERNFRQFLARFLPAQPGLMKTMEDKTVGEHRGLMFYTLGQRQGLGIGGGHGEKDLPWYVLDKDLSSNALIVGQGHDHPELYHSTLTASQLHWISGNPPNLEKVTAKIRYRAKDVDCTLFCNDENVVTAQFDSAQFAIAPGQSVVFYDGDVCLGGAIIDFATN
ncbi:MAG: tRNA 2-thiouridine(34) synthase MnmA [Candidatus Neomarinimicrobiota bacterium]|nr:tRNA 2-thiouridine(34) synthase MnmA [Candidatus Neomarinimicrobiota bacterium]